MHWQRLNISLKKSRVDSFDSEWVPPEGSSSLTLVWVLHIVTRFGCGHRGTTEGIQPAKHTKSSITAAVIMGV